MLRVLTFTNLYPSADRPRHGIFVEQRLRRLVETGKVSARVVVPYAQSPLAKRPPISTAERFGIPVQYVPVRLVPGLTTIFNPLMMALACRRAIGGLGRRGDDFDLIDAHFLYPDGVAAVLLGAWFGKPVTITARGSDANVAARELIAGTCVRWAARRAAALIAVSASLRDVMVNRGLGDIGITVARNGVDLVTFRPLDRLAARRALGLTGPTLLAVGNLVPEKGHDLVLEALRHLTDARLLLIGSGPEESYLRKVASEWGVAERVSWIAPVAQEALAAYFSAADVTVLASAREGMPNVLLESIACGTPVVATAVGGSTEIVAAAEAGMLVHERSGGAIAAACRKLLTSPPAREATRKYAERFGWQDPVSVLIELFNRVIIERRSSIGVSPS